MQNMHTEYTFQVTWTSGHFENMRWFDNYAGAGKKLTTLTWIRLVDTLIRVASIFLSVELGTLLTRTDGTL